MQAEQEIIKKIEIKKDRQELKKLLKRGNNSKVENFLNYCNDKWKDEYYLILKDTVLENPKMNALKVFSYYLANHNGPINFRLRVNRRSNFITHFLYMICISDAPNILKKLAFYLGAMPLHVDDVARVFNKITNKNPNTIAPAIITCFLQSPFKSKIQEIIINKIMNDHSNILLIETSLETTQLKEILQATKILLSETNTEIKAQWIKLNTYIFPGTIEKTFLLNQLFFGQAGGKHDVLPAIKENFAELQYSVFKP